MSMFIVSRNHIDHLVTAIGVAELTTMSPDELGRMLWNENLESAKFRYPNDGDGERPGPIDFRDSDVVTYTWTRTPVLTGGILKAALRSYAYQACEHPAWKDSEACRLVEKRSDELAGVEMDHDGWDL